MATSHPSNTPEKILQGDLIQVILQKKFYNALDLNIGFRRSESIQNDTPEETSPSTDLNYYDLAIKLWESEPIKKAITKSSYEKWCDIEELVLREAKTTSLDVKKRRKVENAIHVIGRKIYYWGNYIIFKLGLNIHHIEKIYWTSDACIDKIKILKLFWSGCPVFSSFNEKINEDEALISIACLFGRTDFIGIDEKVMAEKVKSLISVLNPSYELELEPELDGLPDGVKLFFLSIDNGLDNAVEYFASLVEIDKYLLDKAIKKCMEKCMSVVDDDYLKENLVKIFLFLYNKLSGVKKSTLFSNQPHNIFKIFLNVWPYEENCVAILKNLLHHSDQKQIINLLKSFLKLRNLKEKVLVGQETHLLIFKMLFGKLKPEYKKILFVGSSCAFSDETISNYRKDIEDVSELDKPLTFNLYDELDFPILNIIINDEDLSLYRKNLISSGLETFKTAVKNGNTYILKDFAETVLLSEQDVTDFKTDFNSVLSAFLEDPKCCGVRELLDWLAPLKSPSELVRLCSTVTKLETRKKGLWDCNPSDVKISNYREEVKDFPELDDALREGFCDIWCSFLSRKTYAGKLCDAFLTTFLDPANVAVFKRKKLVNDEKFIQLYCTYLNNPGNFALINDLFQFCEITSEEILSIKAKIIDNLTDWILNFGGKDKKILMLNKVMLWLFNTEFKRIEVVEEFINSSSGAKFCVETIKYGLDELIDEMLVFLNTWIKPCKNIDVLKSEIEKADLEHNFKEQVLRIINQAFESTLNLKEEAVAARVFWGDHADLALEFALVLDAEKTHSENKKRMDDDHDDDDFYLLSDNDNYLINDTDNDNDTDTDSDRDSDTGTGTHDNDNANDNANDNDNDTDSNNKAN